MRKILQYLILCCIARIISIAMCYIDIVIKNINYTLQDFLAHFFLFLSWIIIVIGAIKTFPQDKFSNKRVWFYYIIMCGIIATIDSIIKFKDVFKI